MEPAGRARGKSTDEIVSFFIGFFIGHRRESAAHMRAVRPDVNAVDDAPGRIRNTAPDSLRGRRLAAEMDRLQQEGREP